MKTLRAVFLSFIGIAAFAQQTPAPAAKIAPSPAAPAATPIRERTMS